MKVLLVVYDNGSWISYFPLGMAYLASACRNAGHQVTVFHQDVYHYSDEELTHFIDQNDFDFVGIGSCGGYYQYHKVGALCKAVRRAAPKTFLALGGHLVSPEPEYFLRKFKCDAVCIGEGEVTVVDLLDALENRRSLHEVSGIAFLEDGRCVKTSPRPLIDDVDGIAWPAYDLFPMDHYTLFRRDPLKKEDRYAAMLSGRGCTFTCNFCYRMDPGFRPRSSSAIVEEMLFLRNTYSISYFDFADELLMNSPERTLEICRAIMSAGDGQLRNCRWSCNGRLNYASSEVLTAMKKAGCDFINYGIESMDDEALRKMNKALTSRQIVKGIENTLAAGINPGLNIIFGNIDENQAVLDKDVEFLLKYDNHYQLRTIRPVTPYPGSPLYYYAIEKGLLKDCADFYENKHTNSDLMAVNFTPMSDDEFYDALYKANQRLINAYIDNIHLNYSKNLENLYLRRSSSFRGFRQS